MNKYNQDEIFYTLLDSQDFTNDYSVHGQSIKRKDNSDLIIFIGKNNINIEDPRIGTGIAKTCETLGHGIDATDIHPESWNNSGHNFFSADVVIHSPVFEHVKSNSNAPKHKTNLVIHTPKVFATEYMQFKPYIIPGQINYTHENGDLTKIYVVDNGPMAGVMRPHHLKYVPAMNQAYMDLETYRSFARLAQDSTVDPKRMYEALEQDSKLTELVCSELDLSIKPDEENHRLFNTYHKSWSELFPSQGK